MISTGCLLIDLVSAKADKYGTPPLS
jgi:hypothetical protein